MWKDNDYRTLIVQLKVIGIIWYQSGVWLQGQNYIFELSCFLKIIQSCKTHNNKSQSSRQKWKTVLKIFFILTFSVFLFVLHAISFCLSATVINVTTSLASCPTKSKPNSTGTHTFYLNSGLSNSSRVSCHLQIRLAHISPGIVTTMLQACYCSSRLTNTTHCK